MSLELALHKRRVTVFLASSEEKESRQSRQQKIQASSLILVLLSKEHSATLLLVLQQLKALNTSFIKNTKSPDIFPGFFYG